MLFSLLLATAHLDLVNVARATEAAATNDVADLKRRLKQVTAEADALWRYVGSGPDNPDLAALERAAKLLDKRRAGR